MRKPPTPRMRDLAEKLIAYEAAAGLPTQVNQPAALRVCEKMRRSLTTLAGAIGFQSLLSRALLLAKREAPSLDGLRVNADGSLQQGEGEPKLDRTDTEAGVLLVAHLLQLLVSVIGYSLTLHLIRDLWPDAYFEELTAEGTGTHEQQG